MDVIHKTIEVNTRGHGHATHPQAVSTVTSEAMPAYARTHIRIVCVGSNTSADRIGVTSGERTQNLTRLRKVQIGATIQYEWNWRHTATHRTHTSRGRAHFSDQRIRTHTCAHRPTQRHTNTWTTRAHPHTQSSVLEILHKQTNKHTCPRGVTAS